MITKASVEEQLKVLPSEFSIDELIERLIIIEKIEQGEKDISEGKFKSHEEVGKIINQWSK